jgi:hypothetical protein
MVDVVPGDHADYRFDGFLAALGVLSAMLPLAGRERLEDRESCFAQP